MDTVDDPTVDAVLGAEPPLGGIDEQAQAARLRASLFGTTNDPVRIGRFMVIEPIGRGGAGVVYSAYDPQLDRRVAVKLLRPGAGAELSESEARHRLLREAQAVARLSHPNVIAVYEVGTYEGQVFMAMELVDGVDLRTWLRQDPRDWRAVRDVFLAAGRGLAAAHRAGLVHRDFKPSNVLVGHDGRVRVLDFGLAKSSLARDRSGERRSDSGDCGPLVDELLTGEGTIVGTPAYMAPEQHRGAGVDHRADIYAFGVALHEALSGQRPFGGKSLDELLAAKQAGMSPETPRGRSPAWLLHVVRGCLEPDPAGRIQTMDRVLDAIGREPWYRRKIVIAGVAMATVVLTAWVATAAREERSIAACAERGDSIAAVWDDARRERVKAAFLATGVPYAVEAWHGVGRLMDRHASALRELAVDNCEATEVSHRQPRDVMNLRQSCLEAAAQRLDALAAVFERADAGTVEHAVAAVNDLPALEACVDAEGLRAQHSGRDTDDPLIENLRGELARVRASMLAARFAEARALLEAVQRRAAGLEHGLSAEMLVAEADLLVALGEPLEAEGTFYRAIWSAEALGRDDLVARAWVRLVRVAGEELARHDDVDRLEQHARAAIVRIGGDERLEAELLGNLGTVAWRRDDHDRARADLERALQAWERMGDGLNVGLMLMTLGNVAYSRGDYDRAADYFERARARYDAELGPYHPRSATVSLNLGNVHLARGDYAESAAAYERAHAVWERIHGSSHPRVAEALNNLGAIAYARGDRAESERLHRRALDMRLATYGREHPATAFSLHNLGLTLASLDRANEGERLLGEALAVRERVLGPDHLDTAQTRRALGGVAMDRGEYETALMHYRRALDTARANFGAEHPAVALAAAGVGEALLGLGRNAEAIAQLEQAVMLHAGLDLAPDNSGIARFALARALWTQRAERERARELAREAARDFARAGPGASTSSQEVAQWLRTHAGP